MVYGAAAVAAVEVCDGEHQLSLASLVGGGVAAHQCCICLHGASLLTEFAIALADFEESCRHERRAGEFCHEVVEGLDFTLVVACQAFHYALLVHGVVAPLGIRFVCLAVVFGGFGEVAGIVVAVG